ncbi:major facilitator superfamily protein [mine drainage metagenome]|uniref:Major facilitator superfamily protein n=1 Tax=mine drainage metagenome TaxID=410659 RepID=A0A1J5PET5_9ZZZZ
MRTRLGLPRSANPLFEGQFSPFGTLALYSPVFGSLQPDFPPDCAMTGCCFYDRRRGATERLPDDLAAFLDAGPPPLVFTLGSALTLEPGRFYDVAIKVARGLGRRAVLLVGPDAARRLPAAYWEVVALAALFTVARLTEAFLVLRGDQIGVSVAWIALVTLVLSLAYALSAYPVGVAAARWGRKRPFGLGLAVLAVSMLLLSGMLPLGLAGFWIGVALWGLHMGLTQGLLSAAVAETAPTALRGTAFGLYHLTIGLMQLLAAIGAGWLWQAIGSGPLFALGGALALLCLPVLWLLIRE